MESSVSPSVDNEQEVLADGDNLKKQDKVDFYETFVKKHIQHYRHHAGQSTTYQENFRSFQEWRKHYDMRLSGQHALSTMEEVGRAASFQAKLLDMPGNVFSTEGTIPDDLLHRTTQLVFHYQAGRKIPKLREPRNLYALTKEAGPQQATRWPSHLQVICPAIHFIKYFQPNPDPLHQPSGKEPTPAVRGPSVGELIYYNDPGRDLYFMRSRVAGCRLAMRTTPPPREYPEDNFTLEFESRFESGNLLKVDKITDFDYELTLRTDLYTTKHTQWFFFRVRNMRTERSYRFTIVNLMKPSSLYNQGMKPVFYSEVNALKKKVGWIRSGKAIRYYRNNMCGRDGRSYYSLTWTCEFPNNGDTCYFAHCFPYTYSDLQEYLLELANDPVRSRFCKQRVLTRTLAGNLVYILTITSPSRNPEISRSKRAAVITARVHPGETNASWMMKGFLDYLTSSSADAKLLRDTFIFKIIPMLNPDGVIVGNYRCSLAGRDLNRNYKSVLKDSFPSIWHAKMMIKRLNAERQITVYCDLHGHSRKNNIFIYGCENKHDRSKRLQERVFPLMLAKNASQMFSFDSCKYKVQKSKEGTGRIVVWNMGVMNSYTMEATFGGTSLPGENQNTHLSTADLEMMGYHFCDTLLDYCDPDSSKVEACMKELQDHMKRKILKRLQLQNPNMTDINLDEYESDFESDTSGSDSSCDDGLPVHLLAIAPKLQRKKKLRSRRERMGKALGSKQSPNASSNEKQLSNLQSKVPPDKVKTLRYSQSVSNLKRKDDRQSTATAVFMPSENSSHDKLAKKSEYLEALTSAYIRSGVLMVPDNVKDYSMRYTTNNGSRPQDGTFAVKYLSSHLQQSSGGVSNEEENFTSSPQMRNASCQWSPQPETPGSSEDESLNKDAILAEEQYEFLRQSALRRQLSADQQQLLAKQHLAAVATKQKAMHEKQRISSAHSRFVSSPSQAVDIPFSKEPRRVLTPDLASAEFTDSHQTAFSSPFFQNEGYITSETEDMKSRLGFSPVEKLVVAQQQTPRSSMMQLNDSAGEREETSTKVRNDNMGKTQIESQIHQVQDIQQNKLKPQAKEKACVDLVGSTSTTETLPLMTNKGIKHTDNALSDISSNISNANSKHGFSKEKTDLTKKKVNHKEKEKPDLADATISDNATVYFTSNNVTVDHDEPNPVHEMHATNNESSDSDYQPMTSRSNQQYHEKSDRVSFSLDSSSKNTPEKIFSTSSSKFSSGMLNSNSSLLNLARPSAPRHIHQPDSKCMVKGEVLLPPSTEKISVSSGIKKANAIVTKPGTDKLTVQNSRSNIRTVADSHLVANQKHKYRFYQNSESSFFGMSDQMGLAVIPRNTRVPPVVANIAELRRSLMGHERKMTETALTDREEIRKEASHNFGNSSKVSYRGTAHSNEDFESFGQRFRRSNSLVPLSGQKSERNNKQMIQKEEENPQKANIFSITTNSLSSDSDKESFSDVENASVVATFSDQRHSNQKMNHHHRGQHRKEKARRDYVKQDNSFLFNANSMTNEPFMTTNRSEPDVRRYAQSHASRDNLLESTMTDARIGFRSVSQHGENFQMIQPHSRENSNSADTRLQAISSVSLNMKGDEERMCVTTPALASRPVPPLLRYLSAKQGMNKRK